MGYTDLLKLSQTMQAAGLAADSFKASKKKRLTMKGIVGTGMKGIIGADLIKTQAQFNT